MLRSFRSRPRLRADQQVRRDVMRKLILAAAGLAAVMIPMAGASAQHYGRGYGGYDRDVRQEQRECRRELRRADTRREYRRELRECRRELRHAIRDSRRDWRDDRRDWRHDRRDDRRYWDGRRWRNRW